MNLKLFMAVLRFAAVPLIAYAQKNDPAAENCGGCAKICSDGQQGPSQTENLLRYEQTSRTDRTGRAENGRQGSQPLTANWP
jgi:hypothetical protein